MAHVPHVHLPGPWVGATIVVPDDVRHHLDRVLRRNPGSAVSYTDGGGRVGEGRFDEGTIVRCDEREVPPVQPAVTMIVAPPHRTERARLVVEKLAELGVTGLRWLRTAHTQGDPPRPEKCRSWAVAALQQSRGAHLLRVDGPIGWDGVPDDAWVAHPGASLTATALIGALTGSPDDIAIVIGPEGGFTDDEVPATLRHVSLGQRILRTDTAAVVAAGMVCLAGPSGRASGGG